MASALVNRVKFLSNSRYISRLLIPRTYSSTELDEDYSNLRSSVNILNTEIEDGIFIQSYSRLGFKLSSGIRVMGPCAIFPKSILHWNVAGPEAINEDSLQLFTILEPKLDLLIIGAGDQRQLSRVNPKIIPYLKSKRLTVELLTTEHALATFNFLNAEKRYVAGAFLPPAIFGEEKEHMRPIQAEHVGDWLTDPPPGQGEVMMTDEEIEEKFAEFMKRIKAKGSAGKREPGKRDPSTDQDF